MLFCVTYFHDASVSLAPILLDWSCFPGSLLSSAMNWRLRVIFLFYPWLYLHFSHPFYSLSGSVAAPVQKPPWTTPHCFMSAFPHSFKVSSVLGCPRPSSLNCLYCRGHFPPSLVHKDLLAFRKRLMTASLADALPCNSFACASPSSLARFLPAGNIRLPLPLRSALCRWLVIQR